MALRIKAGGPTQVISVADAKKLGIKVVEKIVKDAGIKPAGGEKKVKEEKKVVGKENQETENGKKASADPKKPVTAVTKVKTAGNAVSGANPISGKKGKDGDEADPIEDSLNQRIKAGGVT